MIIAYELCGLSINRWFAGGSGLVYKMWQQWALPHGCGWHRGGRAHCAHSGRSVLGVTDYGGPFPGLVENAVLYET